VKTWLSRITITGVTITGVSIVAVVAAVASYVHMQHLAEQAGEQWRSWLLPLSVDGLLVAASMVMFVRRRANQPAGVLPWLGLVLGLVASLAANIAVAPPGWLSVVVSGWPPLALAVAFELLILVTRDEHPEQEADEPADTPTGQAPTVSDTPTQERRTPTRKPKRALSAVPNTDRFADFPEWAKSLEQPPSGKQIRDRYGCGYTKSQELLASLDDEEEAV
jgi:hypothetical protein